MRKTTQVIGVPDALPLCIPGRPGCHRHYTSRRGKIRWGLGWNLEYDRDTAHVRAIDKYNKINNSRDDNLLDSRIGQELENGNLVSQ